MWGLMALRPRTAAVEGLLHSMGGTPCSRVGAPFSPLTLELPPWSSQEMPPCS